MKTKFQNFFYRYWWIYYLLTFIFIGIIIYLLLQDARYSRHEDSLHNLSNQIENCNCNTGPIITPIENDENLNDSIRVIDNEGEFGCLSITLFWNSVDDLDLHIIDVNNEHIYFEHFCKGFDGQFTQSGGQLDIDLNAGDVRTNNPVENVYFRCTPPNGSYRIIVHAFAKSDRNPLSFNVIIREKGIVKKQIEGSISRKDEEVLVMDYIYSNNEAGQ